MFSVWRFVHLALFILIAPPLLRAQTAEVAPRHDGIEAFRGEQVYNRACAACHGKAGDGNGPAAKYLDPLPRDFTLGIYKFRSTAAGMLPTDEDLYRTVTFGIPTTRMPAFEDVLTERERRDVVAYIKSFSTSFETMPPAEPITIREEPNATAQSIAEGKSIYMINACWTCHGSSGKGAGEAASSLNDVWGQEIRPVDFTSGEYKGGSDNRSIFRSINTGLTGTPMPSFAESYLYGGDSVNLPPTLSDAYADAEVALLRAYLQSQPTEEEIGGMSDSERESLSDRRAWSLVHYVTSLSREPGLWHRLFVEDTEVTRDR
jgi:cytochrome c oxidase cbb3-type subunit 2